MKIFVITQEDSLVVPKNMQLLADANFIDITGACIIKSKNSLSEKKGYSLGTLEFYKFPRWVLF